jgi:predicted nicotinamide N-methyase
MQKELGLVFPKMCQTVHVGGQAIKVECISDLDQAIDILFVEYEKSGRTELFEELCPYFGQIWPASIGLAELALREAVNWQGKRVLEIGCGLAIPSLALASNGLAVNAMDLHPDVPKFLEKNLQMNEIQHLNYRHGDWRIRDGQEPWQVVLGSDVLYDRSQPEEMIRFIEKNTTPDAEILISDPGRIYFSRFLILAKSRGWKVSEETEGEVFIARLRGGPRE